MKDSSDQIATQETDKIIIKIADQATEFEQIHRLNYETFVLEIAQHTDKKNPQGFLIDKFHDENVYLVAKKGEEVIAMVAIRGDRPFSLEQKIEGIDQLLPSNIRYLCEARLLALKPSYRQGRLALRLLKEILHFALNQGYQTCLISAVVDKIKLYEYQGFKPFGPLLQSGDSEFQPMYCRCEDLIHYALPPRSSNLAYFLPGPVLSHDDVKEELSKPAISHRSEKFIKDFKQLQEILCDLVNSKYVQLMTGSGTMANDVIAAQLELLGEKGLILANGEFGERLIKQAKAHRLNFIALNKPWGTPYSEQEIKSILEKEQGQIRWIWSVHCETSTGMLNDIGMLKNISKEFKIKLCLDCISSLGAVPLDLSNVYLASGSSAKAIGATAGICFVFHNTLFDPQPNHLPAVFDLGYYIQNGGIPFTISTKLIYALLVATHHLNLKHRLAKNERFSNQIREALHSIEIKPLLDQSLSSSAIITIELPPSIISTDVGKAFEQLGILISYNSGYLQSRNWIQFALMGNYTYQDVQLLIQNLHLLKEHTHQLAETVN